MVQSSSLASMLVTHGFLGFQQHSQYPSLLRTPVVATATRHSSSEEVEIGGLIEGVLSMFKAQV